MLNASTLPVFYVEGSTQVVGIKLDTELTRLVSSDSRRHGYLVPSPGGPMFDEAAKEALKFLQRRAVRNALDNFVVQIARQLRENPKVGYLVKINKSAALEDTETLNSDLLSPIGFGMEPIDALAESYRIPALRAAPSAMPDTSEYVWYTWTSGELLASRYEVALPRQLESMARTEANRRFVLGNVKLETRTGIVRAQAAEYWRKHAEQYLSLIGEFERKKRINELLSRLQAGQDQFNFAYENYQAASREMARNAAEMQTLERISGVISLLKTGVEVVTAVKEWREERQASLSQTTETHHVQAQSARQEMSSAQQSLVNEWSPVPGAIWQSPVIPEVDLKIQILERRPFRDQGGGTTQVFLYRD